MEVEFIARIRDELKFESLPLLVAEMERDKERARAILESCAPGWRRKEQL